MTTTARQLLELTGYQICSISPDATVFDAIKLMSEKQVGALLVMEADKLVGIISERDYTRKIVLNNRSSRTTQVREIMTENVVGVRPEQTIEECLVLMSEHHIRHLPVTEDGKPIGVLSVMDVVKDIISAKEFIIQQLENYIVGSV
ncbi:MAG: CBS domain-containing protein [Gammaproteobacteria bacterium]|nr:CBS domain-containing protein [Gammaproteobacteria bacterium]MCI0590453.1 CBS domain-containing protein [Gammaproteobacteria bacterium]